MTMTNNVIEPRNIVAPRSGELHPVTSKYPIKLDTYLRDTRGDVLSGNVTDEFRDWHTATMVRRAGKVEA